MTQIASDPEAEPDSIRGPSSGGEDRFALGLSGLLSAEDLTRALTGAGRWQPYPTVDQRPAWDAVEPDFRRRLLAEAQADRASPWPELTASGYSRFRADGDRQSF